MAASPPLLSGRHRPSEENRCGMPSHIQRLVLVFLREQFDQMKDGKCQTLDGFRSSRFLATMPTISNRKAMILRI